MKSRLIASAVGLAIVQFPIGYAKGQVSCPVGLNSPQGGQVYYYNDGQFVPLTSASILEERIRTRMKLLYVINTGSADRSGVIVIKSARYGLPLNDDRPPADRVKLVRRESGDRCAPTKRPFSGEVSEGAYHEYHDLGQDQGDYLGPRGSGPALLALKEFHTRYEFQTRGGQPRCRETDSKLTDDGNYNARSNRSQFSFDTRIVDKGFNPAAYNITVSFIATGVEFFFPPAQASSRQLREKRVEIKSYHTTNGLACIPFTIKVRAPAQMLRVNDLDARDENAERLQEYRLGAGAVR